MQDYIEFIVSAEQVVLCLRNGWATHPDYVSRTCTGKSSLGPECLKKQKQKEIYIH